MATGIACLSPNLGTGCEKTPLVKLDVDGNPVSVRVLDGGDLDR